MRIRLNAALASALTITFGMIVVLGLLLSNDLGLGVIDLPDTLPDFFPDKVDTTTIIDGTQAATNVLLQLVTITIGLTIVIGILNLFSVHTRRIAGRKKGSIYSAVLIISFIVAVGSYLVNQDSSMILLETVLVSVEAALAGLLLFALVFGAYRMMHKRVTWTGIVFVSALLIVLVGALPLPGVTVVSDIRNWVLEVPVSAGARGILLGIALATIVTGVRVLIGIDRSYRE